MPPFTDFQTKNNWQMGDILLRVACISSLRINVCYVHTQSTCICMLTARVLCKVCTVGALLVDTRLIYVNQKYLWFNKDVFHAQCVFNICPTALFVLFHGRKHTFFLYYRIKV